MRGHIDCVFNAVKRYRRPWIVIPLFALLSIEAGQLVLRAIHWRDLQYASRGEITRSLLEETPLGTDRQLVRQFIDSKGWSRGGKFFSNGGPNADPVDRISIFLGMAQWLFEDEKVFAE